MLTGKNRPNGGLRNPKRKLWLWKVVPSWVKTGFSLCGSTLVWGSLEMTLEAGAILCWVQGGNRENSLQIWKLKNESFIF